MFTNINNVNGDYIMKKDNIEEHEDWNEEYPAEKHHIDFLKEVVIARLEMENDALLAREGKYENRFEKHP